MAFDALYTTNEIQKCKVLLPYIDPSMQKHLAVYIKYMELQYTMKYVRRHPSQINGCSIPSDERPDLRSLCRQLSYYSTPEEIRQLEQLQNMLRTMETMQEMTQTMSALQEAFPDLSDVMPFGNDAAFSDTENAGTSQTGTSSIIDMMMGMLTPEQKTMYEMFRQTDPDKDSK